MTQNTGATSPAHQDKARSLPAWVVITAFAVLLIFLAVIGLGLKRAQAGPIAIGQAMPSFTLTTFDGQTINTADYSGKVVVMNLWASWCKPCEQEAAELEQAWQKYQPGGEVIFLGVAWTDTEPASLAYLKKFQITYPNGPDLGTRIADRLRTTGVPETFFIDRQGKLAFIKVGPFISLGEITTIIDGLLAQ